MNTFHSAQQDNISIAHKLASLLLYVNLEKRQGTI